MGTGILALCLTVTLGQDAGDVRYANFRSLEIPVNVDPELQPTIRELLLFASSDQGREWKQVAGPIASDKKKFVFYAPADGIYWLRVVKVNQKGVRDPDDMSLMRGAPDMKLMIDTLKPIVKSLQTQRQGNDVYVNWDVQEDHPDLTRKGMQLEYQVKDATFERWQPIPFNPALKGQTQFNPAQKRPLVIRLTVRDLAGNQSYGMAEVAGAIVQAGGALPMEGSSAVLPGQLILPKQPSESERKIVQPEPEKHLPPPTGWAGNNLPPLPAFPDKAIPPPPPVAKPVEKVVAEPRFPPPVEPLKLGPPPQHDKAHEKQGVMPGIIPPPETKPLATPMAPHRPLPPIQYVNRHEVMLEYELKRVGPSGVGAIELWLTRNDGETWDKFAVDEDANAGAVNHRQQRKFVLRDDKDRPFPDGVYGLTLVVRNRAGLGKTPRPGDAPEIRIEIDTKSPLANLYPPAADPQHPDHVLLRWTATDENLTATPISIDYAERRDGPWQPIAADIENSGRFSWKLAPNVPVQVYLRVRARDKAGNEFVGVTEQPQYIDFTEPEGTLIGVQTPGK